MNNPKPYYKAKAQNKRKPSKTNLKGLVRVWVPKGEIIFVANMLKGNNKETTLVIGQWIFITYNRKKAYVSNPNSKGGRKCGVLIKPERKDH